MSNATRSFQPRTKQGGVNCRCGHIWDNDGKKTEPQYFAEQMFTLCRGTGRPEHYVSDLYWDFVHAQEHAQEYLDAKPGLLFVYVVRQSGTNIYVDWQTYVDCYKHHGSHRRVFLFEKETDGTVRVREVEPEPQSAAPVGALI